MSQLSPIQAALVRLAKSRTPMTAKDLGVSSKALRACEGVEVVGTQRTGGRGRPALLFKAAR